MKKFLLSIVLFASLALSNQALAQCNITITNAQYSQSGNVYSYSFNWQPTGGNASLQIVLMCGLTELQQLCIVSIKDSSNTLHYFSGSFTAVSVCSPKRIEIRNWTSNNCGGNSCIASTFYENKVAGFKVCNTPRQFNVGITTADPAAKNITYKVFIDQNSNGVWDAGDKLAYTSATISISNSSPYSSGPTNYSYANLTEANRDLIVEVTSSGSAKTYTLLASSCSPLPVNFKSFNANRNKSAVGITWETASESNNKGFEIQRKTSGNDYTTIAFVDTKAKGGNSESDLSYSFSDLNSYKGISQYRIRQIDFDGQSKYTEVRSVRGEEQSTAKNSVYPNPSNNGNVNVVFEDVKSIRDIQLMDMNGRVINQWRNYSNNNIKIENLTSGFYSLRVVDQNTKEQSIEKIIVNRN